jgi:hypothetical protein
MNRSRTASECAPRVATLQQNHMPMFPDAGPAVRHIYRGSTFISLFPRFSSWIATA